MPELLPDDGKPGTIRFVRRISNDACSDQLIADEKPYQELRFWNYSMTRPMSDQSGGYSLERNTSREPAHLTSSRAMVIKPILAEEISENPCCSGNREGLGGFAPIRMTAGIRKKQRYPHE